MIEFTKIFDSKLFLAIIHTTNNFKTNLVLKKVIKRFHL